MSSGMVSDALPETIRVVVVAATGVLRSELCSAFDEDFDAVGVSDGRAAEDAALEPPHALVVVTDDLCNETPESVTRRVRLTSSATFRTSVLYVSGRGHPMDFALAHHEGADDVAAWRCDADLFRARVRSVVRVASLEASMGEAAARGDATASDLRAALSAAIHLINNSVAGISGRAQLASMSLVDGDEGLAPVCLAEARKMGIILASLHCLSEAVRVAGDRRVEDELALAITDG